MFIFNLLIYTNTHLKHITEIYKIVKIYNLINMHTLMHTI